MSHSPETSSMDKEKAEFAHEEVAHHVEHVEYDSAWQKKTIRKIDYRLLIVLGITYAISLIDRTNISVARVAGMGVALQLQIGDRYSIITLVFFIPYIIFELPSMIMMRRVGCRVWLAGIVLSWGAVMTAMAFCTTWQGLAVCRTILGVFEAGFFPGCVFLITTWYKRSEVAKRLSLFYLTSQALSGFSNIIGYGMSLLGGKGGLAGWQWIFVLFGVFTIFLAIMCYLFIVDFPDTNTFLTEKETAFVMQRIEEDRGDSIADEMSMAKVLLHLGDWKGWAAAVLFMCCTTPVYAFSYFLPVVLSGGGYSTQLSLMLSAPPFVAAAGFTFGIAYMSDLVGKRGMFVGINCTVCLTGTLIMALTGPIGIRYFGAFLAICGAQSNVPLIISYHSNNVRSHTKRAVHSALIIGFGGIGGIMASTIFRQADFPRYVPGLGVSSAAQVLSIGILVVSNEVFKRQNARADAGEIILGDLEGFRYTL